MNRIKWLALLFLLIVPQISWSAASTYPNPYRQTTWNTFTDKMHTLGQSPQQAQLTVRKLHQARTNARLISINREKSKGWLHGN